MLAFWLLSIILFCVLALLADRLSQKKLSDEE